MEKISFALMLAGVLLISLKSDALEKFRGGFLFIAGGTLCLVHQAPASAGGLGFLLLLSLAMTLYLTLILPYLSGVKNRNTEDFNDFDD